MKKLLSILPLVAVLFFIFSCNKKSDTSTPDASAAEFKFVSLSVADTTMKVNGIAQVNAVAIGEGLTYNWTASYGTFVGSGPNVMWTVCHADVFTITCEVKDTYGRSDSKTLRMYVN